MSRAAGKVQVLGRRLLPSPHASSLPGAVAGLANWFMFLMTRCPTRLRRSGAWAVREDGRAIKRVRIRKKQALRRPPVRRFLSAPVPLLPILFALSGIGLGPMCSSSTDRPSWRQGNPWTRPPRAAGLVNPPPEAPILPRFRTTPERSRQEGRADYAAGGRGVNKQTRYFCRGRARSMGCRIGFPRFRRRHALVFCRLGLRTRDNR